ncbi:hypothetical protein [Herminiimonas sp. CN]|uniref:hypothetical protein n=1 Tax=Herminiimonas sp. CN TaxID=1349818 RepID=UPI0009DF5B29|nr:hypothetical protein [Herminiimonas sp. CN]
MQWFKSALLFVTLCGAVAGEPVWAQRVRHGGERAHVGGRAHVGVVIGAPLFWPYYPSYYSQPYYYPYPSVIAVPSSPPVYIEQEQQLPPQQYWYFCNSPQGYYPYVKQCPSGWQQVVPQPPRN